MQIVMLFLHFEDLVKSEFSLTWKITITQMFIYKQREGKTNR